MKLQLTLPTGFTAEPLAAGQLRYFIPRGLAPPPAAPLHPPGNAATESGGALSGRSLGPGSERIGGERIGGERIGGERIGGERIGSERIGGERSTGGERTAGDRTGGEPIAGSERAFDSVLLVRESLPLPLALESWPLAALNRLKLGNALLPALPEALSVVPAATAAQWRVQLHSTRALSTASGWPATLVHAAMVDGRDQLLFGCIAALYRFLSYGAEAIFVSADRERFAALREPLLNILATGRPLWPRGEPPSIHHMLYDEPPRS